jgi:hypothetical protein
MSFKIILHLDDSIDSFEATQIAEGIENQPWCMKAEVTTGHCGNCARPDGEHVAGGIR